MVPDESGQSRRLLLVHCDAFYVQVARLEDPEGAGKVDLLLVGNSQTGRGVVTSASYVARRFSVRRDAHGASPAVVPGRNGRRSPPGG